MPCRAALFSCRCFGLARQELVLFPAVRPLAEISKTARLKQELHAEVVLTLPMAQLRALQATTDRPLEPDL